MRAPTGPSPAGHTWDAAVAVAFALQPGETATIDVVHAWWFPNRYADFDRFGPQHSYARSRFWVGNHYATRFGGALDVLDAYLADREHLDTASRAWADAVRSSDLPPSLREVVSAQGTLVRSPTLFRTADGRAYGFEGALGTSTRNWNGDVGGSCPLNCNHVFNYEQAFSRLFPDLGRDMRDTELSVQAPDGSLPHRVVLPLYLPQLNGVAIGGPERPALDGMLGAVLKTYRSVLDGAGDGWLRGHWPALRRLMDHITTTWDADGDGVLQGDQPVTYDISLHGPNMFVGGLWLAALLAMDRMACLVEPSAAAFFQDRFTIGSENYDKLLWNGEFYAQPATGEAYDFGRGCLSDQLLGQWWAHQLGLGHILPADRVRTALASIVRYNLRTGFPEHGYRVFADGDETGLVVCSWPDGGRPEIPLRYCDEVWTGVEYQVAAHCVYEGLTTEAMSIVTALQSRYDGTRRNPFNEVECGDHYVRAMAGWSLLDAYTGFHYDATTRRLRVGRRPGRFPFVAGTAWGTVTITPDGEVHLAVLGGDLPVGDVELIDPPVA
jgi:non-lysosomal glucosylceramidase